MRQKYSILKSSEQQAHKKNKDLRLVECGICSKKVDIGTANQSIANNSFSYQKKRLQSSLFHIK